MAIGDGIRRNIAHVSAAERIRFRNAIVQLNNRYYPDGISKWVKQDEIHEATHVHTEPSFLPWHRELCNRFEQLLREIDPGLSLHYWDWTEDPRAASDGNGGTVNLFTSDFMGSSSGPAGPPFDGFSEITRSMQAGAPGIPSDNVIIDWSNGAIQMNQFNVFRRKLEGEHGSPEEPGFNIHGYIGGTIGNGHTAFEDPFVFLLHSNVDRIWAMWQTVSGQEWRLDPLFTYGSEINHSTITENMEPWAGGSGLRPWTAPDNQQVVKNSRHPSVVTPPCYDTNFNNAVFVEVTNTGTPPVINFNDIPSGDTAVRAAAFRVYGCGSATIRVRAGDTPSAPFSVLHPALGTVVVPHSHLPYREDRIWLAYTAGAAGVPVPDGSVTFECVESGQTFTFTLRANAIVRPRVAVMLSLDQSGSMDSPAGTSGAKRIDVLKDAAKTFMELIPQNSGVGLIRFDHDAYPVNHATFPGLSLRRINSNGMFDPDRVAAVNAVSGHTTNSLGYTSVGDGVQLARDILNPIPIADYEQKAIIVFTDGLENRPLSIADVTGAIDNRTFAIGLGNETQVNTNALRALTNGTGGYLLLTGLLTSDIDDYFRLTKYFLQILAGVTNNNTILDPNGFIAPGMIVDIPFHVNEADIDGTVILLTDYPVVDMVLETPGRDIIDSGNAAALGIDFAAGAKSKNYRFSLPVAFSSGNHAGKWIARLKVDEGDYKKYESKLRDSKDRQAQSFLKHGARYSLVVNTYSNLKMEAFINQNSLEPGSTLTLRTLLNEYGIPVENRASVNVEIKRPDNSRFSIVLDEIEPGIFEKSFVASIPGTYFCRFVARGATLRGTEFTREQTLTGAVFQGGDSSTSKPTDSGIDGTPGRLIEKCCQNLTRILIGILILILILIVLQFRG